MSDLYKLSILISPEAEEATVELLQDTFHRSACVETDLEKGTTQVSVFLHHRPSRKKLSLPSFSVRKLRHENWAESWKRHFKPIEIGSKLLIKPSWSRRKPKAGQALVILDPGLSFGTGQHPTTRFCLEQIADFRKPGEPQSMLDIGTGSGILAIAAAKLGYCPVEAFDIDPEAVRIARANATKNQVLKRIHLAHHDLSADTRRKKYELICANLLFDLLLSERKRLLNRLKPNGRLVLAGLLRLQFDDIQAVYEKSGLKLIASRAEGEWRSGAFQAQKGRQKFPIK